MKKVLASVFLGACLMAPVGVMYAEDHPQHVWNDGENSTWHQYLKEKHIKDHEWEKSNKREQANYWKWRDQHKDSH